ncbi:MAG: hypothetical protein J6X55_05805 [Victivallales bacterium]|nr:hypothetical protein [Victivallales bacterium]
MRLDGLWDFAFVKDLPDDISTVTYNDKLLVPSCFDMDPRYLFARGVGIYRRHVECGSRVHLDIGGLGLRGIVFFDGRELGRVETAYMAADYHFDAGPHGRHELIILTDNRYDDAPSSNFHEWYDICGYGGIYRHVDLTEEPPYWIERAFVTTTDYARRIIRVRVAFAGELPTNLSCKIFIDNEMAIESMVVGGSLDLPLALSQEYSLWSPKSPNLHQLRLEAGEICKTVSFGIRQITIKDSRIHLNGEVIKLLGYNRHDAHPDFGTAVPYERLMRDLRMIHDQGANFIRGSHYPQSEEMLDECDRLGIMVWDESLGWGDKPDSLIAPEFQRKQLEQTRRMVRRSANHPCIVVWGFLNECKANDERARDIIQKLVDLIHCEDDSRPVSYASCMQKSDKCYDIPDIVTLNLYPCWYWHNSSAFFNEDDLTGDFDSMLDFVTQHHPGKPIIIGEIGAEATPGWNDGTRWSEDYQAQLDTAALRKAFNDSRLSGLAIWQFCNNRTHNITEAFANPHGFNNKGVVDEYRRPKGAWHAISRFFREIGWA